MLRPPEYSGMIFKKKKKKKQAMLEIQNFILLHNLLRLQIMIDNLTYYHYRIIDIIFLCTNNNMSP